VAAARTPDAATVRAATGAGIRAMIPLQAALAARAGAVGTAFGLLAAGPVARAATRVVAAT
jgi:4-hydroxybenzoate polyprenyltransferase